MSEGRVPRVALLLSGLPRQWRHCLPTQLELLKNYPHDVFFHFWDTVDAAEKQEITALLKPRAALFEPPQDFSHIDSDPSLIHDFVNIPSRTFSQYASWRGAARLFEPFKDEYDIAIRSRSDLQFVYALDHIIPKLNPNDILMSWWDDKKLLSDLFAVGGVGPILYYHKLADRVLDYARQRQFNAELMLTTHFEARPDIHIYSDPKPYFFVRRPHMDGYTVEQAMLENPGRNKWLDPEIVEAHSRHHRDLKGEKGDAYIKEFRHSQLRTLLHEVKQKLGVTED